MSESRRQIIVRLKHHAVLALFTRNEHPNAEHLVRHFIPGLPAGYKVLAVNNNFAALSFDFLIEHDSFPELEAWQEAPVRHDLSVESVYDQDWTKSKVDWK